MSYLKLTTKLIDGKCEVFSRCIFVTTRNSSISIFQNFDLVQINDDSHHNNTNTHTHHQSHTVGKLFEYDVISVSCRNTISNLPYTKARTQGLTELYMYNVYIVPFFLVAAYELRAPFQCNTLILLIQYQTFNAIWFIMQCCMKCASLSLLQTEFLFYFYYSKKDYIFQYRK